MLQRAVFHVQSSGKSEVTGANILVAIFSEQQSQAVYFLKSQNVSRPDVVNFITPGIHKDEESGARSRGEGEPGEEDHAETSEAPLDTSAPYLN